MFRSQGIQGEGSYIYSLRVQGIDYTYEGAFTLGVKDFSVESANTMLVI
jgi:hypothetical protein